MFFITKLLVQTMILDIGTHMSKVKSKDSFNHLQFPILKLGHYRDCHELRTLRELEEHNTKDFN